MPQEKVLTIQVEGGAAKPGPPLGPTLSSLGLNVKKVVDEINEKTKDFKGMTIPVKITINMSTKEYKIEVGIPTITTLLLREAGASEPSGDPEHKKVGDLKLEKVVEIAVRSRPKLLSKNLENAVKSILGSAKSIGLTVEGKNPKDVIKEIEDGKHKELLEKYENEYLR
ncbi:ribosomal protein L11 [Caldisphaera lagunensis DSM 15908]|uniref:Large ribosomal subunit protein uL11 n=1 Tax=Caldisphaera lagunensis (strain DSM 15908 / JCM 11604 / ANMR 0165 / IC-154) TaxID=1056495 RepID=L0AAV2_CALLD|nr:50S ribosomal protein L11 [Caldisphaera lagunensis]AFZ71011.1 ribosomal protein L11 [Caldisphaera lagunensis DSM 15908]